MAVAKEKIPLDFGSPTSDIPPEALRRDVRGAFVVSALSFAVASVLVFEFSMKAGSFPFPIAEINSALLKVAANKASFGFLFNDKGPALVNMLTSEPLWGYLSPRLGFSGLAGSIVALALGKAALRPYEGARHLRGRRRVSGEDASRVAMKLNKDPRGIAIHPMIRPSLQDWASGAYMIGSPGGGKTTILLPIIDQIIKRGEKIIILDVKGDFSAKFPEAFVFAPWLSNSLIWDPSADIPDEAFANSVAKVLIPEGKDSGKDVWNKAAQAVVSALLIELVKTKPGAWDYSDLAEMLTLPVEGWLEIMRRNTPSQAKVLEGAAETTASVAFTVSASLKSVSEIAQAFSDLKSFLGPEAAAKRRFSFKEWMESDNPKHRAIILRLDMKNKSLVESIFPFFVELLAILLDGIPDGAMRDRKPSWLILDEFAQLQKMRTILKFYELGRSKGFRTILATQSPSQIIERYGKEGAQIFQSASKLKIIFQVSAGAEQETVAREILGDREIQFRTSSVSTGTGGTPSVSSSLQNKKIPVFYPSELGSRLGFWSTCPDDASASQKRKHAWKRKIRNYLHSKFPKIIAKVGPDKFIRAALVCDDEILELDWPILDFPDRRKGTEKSRLLPRYREGYAKAIQIAQGSISDDRHPADLIKLHCPAMTDRDIKWILREAMKGVSLAKPEETNAGSGQLTAMEQEIFDQATALAQALEIEAIESSGIKDQEADANEIPKRKIMKKAAARAALVGAGGMATSEALADDFADLESLFAPDGEGDSIEEQIEELTGLDGLDGIGHDIHVLALAGDALDAFSSPSPSNAKDERGKTRDDGLGRRRSSFE